MGLWDRLTGQFIDIIEWLDDHPSTMVYRFPATIMKLNTVQS